MSKTHIPRHSGVGVRQVLKPGTKKAVAHPWRDRLHAAKRKPSECEHPATKVDRDKFCHHCLTNVGESA